MLVEFSVENFLSIRDRVTFSMLKTEVQSDSSEQVIQAVDDLHLLKSAAIYGANASGKSNLLKALNFMKFFVLTSSKETQSGEPIPAMGFKFSTETDNKPSTFEIVFIHEHVQYRYRYSINTQRVIEESLRWYDEHEQEERLHFERDDSGIRIQSSFREGEGLQERTRENVLFLSAAANWNGEISETVLAWFRSLKIVSGLNVDEVHSRALHKRLQDEGQKSRVLELLRRADFSIVDIVSESREFPAEGDGGALRRALESSRRANKSGATFQMNRATGAVEVIDIITKHKKYDKSGKNYVLESLYLSEESEGTQKFLALASPILDSLEQGTVLIIDEFDARLHPLLSRAIVELFNSEYNKTQAQLIFATHDGTLLKRRLLRQDQIWLMEKDELGASSLYSLSDFEIPADASFELDYIRGKYGGIPLIRDLGEVMNDEQRGTKGVPHND